MTTARRDRSARLGPAAELPFTCVPNALLFGCRDLGVTEGQAWLALQLMSFKWTEEAPYPSLAKIAERTGVRRETLTRRLDGLVRAGLVTVDRTPGRTHRYGLEPLLTRIADLHARSGQGDARAMREGDAAECGGPPDASPGRHQGDSGSTRNEERGRAAGASEGRAARPRDEEREEDAATMPLRYRKLANRAAQIRAAGAERLRARGGDVAQGAAASRDDGAPPPAGFYRFAVEELGMRVGADGKLAPRFR